MVQHPVSLRPLCCDTAEPCACEEKAHQVVSAWPTGTEDINVNKIIKNTKKEKD